MTIAQTIRPAADRLLASATAVLTFIVYLLTIYPGIYGLGDAAKFAFVGKVLGTPHAPGYPLYVMVSHLFSYLPFGTLAYRMNVLSAVLGSAAVAVCYFATRALGVRRAVSVAVALAFGFGQAFWSKTQYPKGYTLNAMMVGAGILMLLRWRQSNQRWHLYAAMAIFALSVGNHLIIIALVPALVLYTLLTDYRAALAPRTLALAALFLTIGFSQYSLILIRTLQNAPYLEARATNVSELVDVVTARRWTHEIVAFSASDVAQQRAPIIFDLVQREMTTAGLGLVLIGFVALHRRYAAQAWLCLLGAVGVIGLTMNMSSNEDEGFLLPAFFMLWLLAAGGLEYIAALIARVAAGPNRWRRGAAVAISVVVLAALPATLIARNYRVSDHSERTFEIRYLNALFEMLPHKSAIVLDRYPMNMMLYYKLLGEKAHGDRDIILVDQRPDEVAQRRREGYHIYAFAEGQEALGQFGYEFAPVQLLDLPLPEYLARVPDGATVAVAASRRAVHLLQQRPEAWARVGASRDRLFAPVAAPYGLIGIAGADSRGMEAPVAPDVRLDVADGQLIASTGKDAPQTIQLTASTDDASVSVAGEERARTASGAVLAVVQPGGSFEAHALDPSRGLRVPFDMRIQPLYTLTASSTCVDIGNVGWRDLTAIAASGRLSLRVDNYRPFDSSTVLYVAGPSGVEPALTEVSGTGTHDMSVRTYRGDVPGDREALAKSLATDNVTDAAVFNTRPFVSRIEVRINDRGNHKAVDISLGASPAAVAVRTTVDLNNPKRAIICGRDVSAQ